MWDGSWVEELNKTITPHLKDMYFDHYKEEFTIEDKIYYGQDLVKVVIEISKDHFLETLKGGALNEGLLIARLEGWIVRDYGFQLFQANKQEKSS